MLQDALNNLQSALDALLTINRALDATLIVAITDKRGRITFANQKFCDISKYTRDELLGQTHRIINSGYHSKAFFKDMWRTIGRGKIWRGDIRNRAKDGSIYWVDTTIVPVLDENGKPYQYVSFRVDITERKHAEEQLRRLDRLDAVGQLASSIAHEIRNPLAAIKMALQGLQMDANTANQDVFQMVVAELDRIDKIVDQFMYLSRTPETTFQAMDVRPVLDAAVALMSLPARRQGVRIEWVSPEPVGWVRADAHQLQQVFINLLKNAIEAMPDGGTIRVQLFARHGQAVVRIQDEGCGIPPEALERLGEPFLTTKQNGTGLGLTVSFKIIQEHGGTIHFDSQPQQGCTVEIRLPLLSAA
ncbi:two-component system sensor histidine kinase NtrB [Alicyclobacillus herbarius]|uniref:two-component system sensor histidine kinase NtrB n=1 Tax=Alicyclobacillus herbarius TaxID=122960 RepID=UPI000429E017|nr:ATP-binding protein [Alicyclobacillus herbarius]